MFDPRSILITGASSGIGEALALEYAAAGVFLALSGRSAERLAAVAIVCSEAGATVVAETIDVTDMESMRAWIERMDDDHPLDLVIANAGISGGGGGRSLSENSTRNIFSVNMAGVLNTVLPVVGRMQKRGRGRIALMSSLAGFYGMPGAPAYSASKVMVKAWGEALRGRLANDGIGVTVICPGFVESRITAANDFKMPMLMDAPRAARIIRAGLKSNPAVIAFPWPMAFAIRLLGLLPVGLRLRLLSRLPEKD